MNWQKLCVAGLAGLALVRGACPSPASKAEMHKVEAAWKSPSKGRDYDKVVVVGLTDKADRNAVEDRVVALLAARGVTAFPSHDGWKDRKKTSFDSFNEFLKLHDIKGVVTIEVDAAEAGDVQQQVAAVANENFSEVVEASWTTEDVGEDVVVQVTLWDAANWKPMWSGTSDTLIREDIGPDGIADFASTTLLEQDVL